MIRAYFRNYKTFKLTFLGVIVLLCVTACGDNGNKESQKAEADKQPTEPIFKEIHFTQSGINFINTITEDETHNFFNFTNIYNGAGIAVGDFNNDGLQDAIFVSNQKGNKLFINQGGLKFENMTDQAGIKSTGGWKNGVTVVDINADGLDDIYITRSGRYKETDMRSNLLYVNNGDLTFTERAKEFGLADAGYGVQAYFFDYDRDGDLDMYQLNHRIDFANKNIIKNLIEAKEEEVDPFGRDRFYRNDNGKFREISKQAGIMNSAWGLSAVVGDYNEDGWDDVYVANDYLTRDLLYINNQDGTFTESIADYFQHISFFSMGSDIADIDNDGHMDLITLDMAPEDHVRSKRLMASMSNEVFRTMVKEGLQHQYMLNTLQYNHGGGNFSEIGQLSGISKTDWSWTALFGDYDADGMKDLFVTNGIRKDLTDNDAMIASDKLAAEGRMTLGQVLQLLPSAKLLNPIYKNKTGLKFEKANEDWGMTRTYNSNGAVYADFDNDGDLDIMLNNMDLMATFYQNLTVEKLNRKLNKIELIGPDKNKRAIGTTLKLITKSGQEIVEKVRTSRGFLSSSDHSIHFANNLDLDRIEVYWPTGEESVIENIDASQNIKITYGEVPFSKIQNEEAKPYFIEASTDIKFKHQENDFDDFIREILLPHRQSEHGPFINKADVNGDGLDDIYIGGAHQQASVLYLQNANGSFKQTSQSTFERDKAHEDMNSLFFDFDGDQDLDLYVVSGGGEFYQGNSNLLRDRLYINDGSGNFTKANRNILPNDMAAGSKALASDIDGDNDLDLIVLNRNVPGDYPKGPKSFIYTNDNGRFTNSTRSVSPDLFKEENMVVDGTMADVNGDGVEDLVLVGEWIAPQIYLNDNGTLEKSDNDFDDLKGWWKKVVSADIDNDGDLDLIVGNQGLNNKFHPKKDSPLYLFYNDFDNNGVGDIVLSKSNGEELLPVRGRECSSQQMPFILEKFDSYEKFANANLTSIYSQEGLDASLKLEVNNFASGILINNGDMSFEFKALPMKAQFGVMNDIIVKDVNGDGLKDIVSAGNFFGSEVETVRYDSNYGSVVMNNGNNNYSVLPLAKSGLALKTDVRDLQTVNVKGEEYLIVTSNNDETKSYKYINNQ